MTEVSFLFLFLQAQNVLVLVSQKTLINWELDEPFFCLTGIQSALCDTEKCFVLLWRWILLHRPAEHTLYKC